MHIAVVGSGYVGLVSAASFAELGHDVTCVDIDQAKIDVLKNGGVPIFEEHLPELLARTRGKKLQFTVSLQEAIESSEAIFIAVGTPPSEGGEADLSYVEAVARGIGKATDGYRVVVEKSTVPVYTCEWIRRVLGSSGDGQRFDVVSNPEFLREGTAVSDFLSPDRIVVGVDSSRAEAVLRRLYEPLTSGEYYSRPDALIRRDGRPAPELVLTSAKSAELIKHASNAFLALKISYVNAVAEICENVGADIEGVCRGMGSDPRIGSKFLNPGIGYGGSCFPKDLTAFRSVAAEFGSQFTLLDEVIKINERQSQRFVRKVRGALWNLRGKKLGVLGLAFKGGTDDIRESRAIVIIEELLKEKCSIRAYDPEANEHAREALPAGAIEYTADAYAAAEGADALLILTDWEEFRHLDLALLKSKLVQPIVLDGRNLYSAERMASLGFEYYSMGRPAVGAIQLQQQEIEI